MLEDASVTKTTFRWKNIIFQCFKIYGKHGNPDQPSRKGALPLTLLHMSDCNNCGTLKDDRPSLSINILASNYCLCYGNIFQNGVNPFSKMINHFLPKRSKLCIFPTIRICSNFTSMWSKWLSNNVWRDFRLPMSASVMIT